MKRILSSLLIAVMAVTAFAAERSLALKGAVSSIHVSTGVDVKYIPGNAPAKVKITGPQKYIDNIDVTLRNGNLHIECKKEDKKLFGIINNCVNRCIKDVKVTLYAPPVAEISVSSGASVEAVAPINLPGESASLSASSGGDLEIERLTCGSLECSTSSGADIEIDILTVKSVRFSASSGSDIEIDGLTAESVKAKASSGADITLEGTANTANVGASSGASVNIRKLSCPDIDASSSSAGSIKRR